MGPILSLTVLAELPELGRLSHGQIAALVGGAPPRRASGTRRGRRAVWGGRAAVRTVLYRGTLRATRGNPAIRRFYDRLVAAGKAKKVALVACRQKVLTILNALRTHQTPWQAQAALSLPGEWAAHVTVALLSSWEKWAVGVHQGAEVGQASG
jgi:transposase